MSKRGLGKGLSALLPTSANNEQEAQKSSPVTVPVKDIIPNPYQPRLHFDTETLHELAQSISEHGIVQPLALRKHGDKYQLIAGERRLRAAKINKLQQVPAIILELDEHQMAEVSLIENIQRDNLNAMEEAYSYSRLINEFGVTQEELAKRIGKSRSFVANMVRLVNLPDDVQQMVKDEVLTAGHARCLLSITNKQQLISLAEQIVLKHLSVRQTEQLVKQLSEKVEQDKVNLTKTNDLSNETSPIYIEIEEFFRQALGTKVLIKQMGDKKGKIEIEYYSDEDLERIYELVSSNKLSC